MTTNHERLSKLTLDLDGVDTPYTPAAIFERQVMSTGAERIFLGYPSDQPNLFRTLVALMPEPYFLLHILHTPRGVGEEGRYQSPALSLVDLTDLLARYGDYLAGDGRHDTWVYSPESRQTLVWDRHNRLFVEGAPLLPFLKVLEDLGYVEGEVVSAGAGPHTHYYRDEFDALAGELLAEFDWHITPLRPEDEQ